MRAKSALMMELEKLIRQRGMTQTEAAALFGVTQPRSSNPMGGNSYRQGQSAPREASWKIADKALARAPENKKPD